MFDEQPDGDPHGECAAEIHRLQELVAQLKYALSNLYALVNGECPRLLDGDRDGDEGADRLVREALQTAAGVPSGCIASDGTSNNAVGNDRANPQGEQQ